MRFYLSTSILILTLALSSTTFAQDWSVIVDYDLNGGQGYSETGNWRNYGSAPYAVGNNYRYLSHFEYRRTRHGQAFWQTPVPYDGIYRVSVSFRATENRSPDADYYVLNENGGYDHTSVSQIGHGALTWRVMGLYEYKKGQVAKVYLDGKDDTHSDCADAVKWELVERVYSDPGYMSTLMKILLLKNDK